MPLHILNGRLFYFCEVCHICNESVIICHNIRVPQTCQQHFSIIFFYLSYFFPDAFLIKRLDQLIPLSLLNIGKVIQNYYKKSML
jgi:hypothetical protein